MTEPQRYKLTLAYRGTRYHGWQRQLPADEQSAAVFPADRDAPLWPPLPPGEGVTKLAAGERVTGEGGFGSAEAALREAANELPTIQNEVRMALIRTLGHDVTVVGASRTDAGVHALGQVAHFDTIRTQILRERILLAANAKLPDDIRIESIEAVSGAFDAISSATSKAYRYVIHNAPLKDIFRGDLAMHLPKPLDLEAMRAAAAHLVGEQDFASFAKPGHGRETTLRRVTSVTVEPADKDVRLEFVGGGFLWHQVRIMAGTLIQVGLGRRDPSSIPEVLAARDRQAAGPTAPARGLYLRWVRY